MSSSRVSPILVEQDEQQPPAKRKRLVRACNACRKRKIRCDELQPKCTRCVQYGLECIVTLSRGVNEQVPALRKRSTSNAGIGSLKGAAESALVASTSSSIAAAGSIEARLAKVEQGLATLKSAVSAQYPAYDWNSEKEASPPAIEQVHHSPQYPPANLEHQVAADLENDSTFNYSKFIGSSSPQIFLQWLDRSFLALGLGDRVGPLFAHGMMYVETLDDQNELPSSTAIWPNADALNSALDMHFSRSRLAFPLLIDVDAMRRQLKGLLEAGIPLDSVHPATAMSLSAIASIALSASSSTVEMPKQYAYMGYARLAQVVGKPFIPSVRALALLALAFRAIQKDGVASFMLASAVRIAQSLGLHRTTLQDVHNGKEDACLWYSIYCLDKLTALETGRPCAINDDDCFLPASPAETKAGFLALSSGLAPKDDRLVFAGQCYLMTLISRMLLKLFSLKTPANVADTISECDRDFMDFLDVLPASLRPESIAHSLAAGIQPSCASVFMAVTHNQAVSTLHRAALVFGFGTDAAKDRSSTRGRGEIRCVEAARATARIVKHIRACDYHCSGIQMTAVIMGLSVLAIHTLKHARHPVAADDFDLFEDSAIYAENGMAKFGQSPDFYRLFSLLRDLVSRATQTVASRPPTPPRDSSMATSNPIPFDMDALMAQVYGQSANLPLAMPADDWTAALHAQTIPADSLDPILYPAVTPWQNPVTEAVPSSEFFDSWHAMFGMPQAL